tara:strand:- start:285 stop:743 length:459 start_codon:yes stop_codon:yes gene_type:complete
MNKGITTGLLILGGLYIFTNRKNRVSANTGGSKNTDKIITVNPAIVYSGPIVEKHRVTPIEKIVNKPIQKVPNVEVKKKIMDSKAPVITESYLIPGGNPNDELWSSVDGEILPDRDFVLKPVKTNYSNDISEYVPPGYRMSSGFGGSGLADM